MNTLKIQLEEMLGADGVRTNEDMRKHTSFKAGGKADYFLVPRDAASLTATLRLLNAANMDAFVLGNGTNVLVRDGGYRGAILYSGAALGGIEFAADTITCGAGVSLASVARAAAEHGLSGMEAISGIPGSIGGALYMNAGAYDGTIADIVTEARIYDTDNDNIILTTNGDMRLSYRFSAFQQERWVILSVTLRLRPGNREDILRAMNAYARKRNDKQPMNLPSAGSFFKRPEGAYAGKLIEDAGLKGYSVGGARISEKHAGFIVNTGGATASDILALAEDVKRRVQAYSGFVLEPEPRIIGSYSTVGDDS
ncbi:MAG: UDP-N-acetylmuramate dehydrogenase [Clostridiales Family XIII bacterium]|jgi:UDP-N-acetylmuramate dehydrogenase|nr:UDP-N-acetylmuramate dehydrogenase [Clostridiales Family XIII bacterium]